MASRLGRSSQGGEAPGGFQPPRPRREADRLGSPQRTHLQVPYRPDTREGRKPRPRHRSRTAQGGEFKPCTQVERGDRPAPRHQPRHSPAVHPRVPRHHEEPGRREPSGSEGLHRVGRKSLVAPETNLLAAIRDPHARPRVPDEPPPLSFQHAPAVERPAGVDMVRGLAHPILLGIRSRRRDLHERDLETHRRRTREARTPFSLCDEGECLGLGCAGNRLPRHTQHPAAPVRALRLGHLGRGFGRDSVERNPLSEVPLRPTHSPSRRSRSGSSSSGG